MPRSKHRRKAGGKAVKRPGHGKPPREMPLSAREIAFERFHEIYNLPFHAARSDHGAGHREAGYMLDLVADAGFNSATLTFRAISRDDLFADFMEPLEEEVFTLDQAVAVLAFLAEQDMVVVDGDQVLIPPRFVDAFFHSLASDGPISAVSVG